MPVAGPPDRGRARGYDTRRGRDGEPSDSPSFPGLRIRRVPAERSRMNSRAVAAPEAGAASTALVGELVASLPGALGFIHRAIGRYQQFVGDPLAVGYASAGRDTDARTDSHPLLGEHPDLGDRGHD